MSDLERLRGALQDVEKRAASLPWAHERQWRAQTHVGKAGNAVLVDLHDLSVKLGLAVVEVVARLGPGLDTGAVVFVTGRGRHVGGHSVLRDAVTRRLGELGTQKGWSVRPAGPGRVRLVIDPAAASDGMGWFFWAFVILLIAAIVLVVTAQ